ncbi:class I SAM-dependent methyltransferase [Algoriphagus sp. SE2]|uniref:class I SAM-dependent methyltransferase n=1 Tax=Algoriphagus sp. SE2 TaxID=3141536 RepID=UPI0031CD3DF4
MKQFWNDRYASEQFAYGQEPNVFFKQELDKLKKGKILLPADGEGRNSVYAARQGWESFACDISIKGKEKAMKLAKSQNVDLNYSVGDFGDLSYEDQYFDTIALIYAHFPAEKKHEFHRLVDQYLKVGGRLVLEAFSKNHLQYNSKNSKVGGPKDIDMLYSVDEIRNDFSNYDFELLEEIETYLSEGEYHIGRGSVVRCVGRKQS